MNHSPRLPSPQLSKALSPSVVHLFRRNIRLADAATRIDDVVVWVDAAEDGIMSLLDNLRFFSIRGNWKSVERCISGASLGSKF